MEEKGFSLIELLIVVAIILIIAAIAIPDLLKSRQAAQQASAVGSLRTLNTAEVTYGATYTTGYSQDLISLDGNAVPGTQASAGLIDSILGSGIKSGYGFEYQSNASATQACTNPPTQGAVGTPPIASYSINASPLLCVAGNGNYYYTDQSGAIRQNNTAPAGTTDPPLAG
jgi:type IV pilus assembly protein PilA